MDSLPPSAHGQFWFIALVAAFAFGRWSAQTWQPLTLCSQGQSLSPGEGLSVPSAQPLGAVYYQLSMPHIEAMFLATSLVVLAAGYMLYLAHERDRGLQILGTAGMSLRMQEAGGDKQQVGSTSTPVRSVSAEALRFISDSQEQSGASRQEASALRMPRSTRSRGASTEASLSAPGNLQGYEAQPDDNNDLLLRSCKSASLTRYQTRNYKVIIVDDDVLSLSATRTILERQEGFVVDTMASAEELLQELEDVTDPSQLPDVILLDMRLPGMCGIEATHILRKKWSPADLSIIIITGQDQPAHVATALDAGASDFIHKPLRLEELKARINTQLALKRSIEFVVEANKSFSLLHSVFPPHIITQLKERQNVAHFHPNLTILFSDIKGYTQMASQWPTEKLILMLNELFTAFDIICEKFNVYKVETIGDAYMIASGHDDVEDHASRMMKVAEAMLQAAEQLTSYDGCSSVNIRIGVHTGPAYSGVVGRTRPRYCFIGDTVNTASRMESNGYPGAVQVSTATYQAVQEWQEVQGIIHEDSKCSFAALPPRHIKGKGMMVTHLLKVGAWEAAYNNLSTEAVNRMESNPIFTPSPSIHTVRSSRASTHSTIALPQSGSMRRASVDAFSSMSMRRTSQDLPVYPLYKTMSMGHPRRTSSKCGSSDDELRISHEPILKLMPGSVSGRSMYSVQQSLLGTPAGYVPRLLSDIMESNATITNNEELKTSNLGFAAYNDGLGEGASMGTTSGNAVDKAGVMSTDTPIQSQGGMNPSWPAVKRSLSINLSQSHQSEIDDPLHFTQLSATTKSLSRCMKSEVSDFHRTLKPTVSFGGTSAMEILSSPEDADASFSIPAMQPALDDEVGTAANSAVSIVGSKPSMLLHCTNTGRNHRAIDNSSSASTPRVEDELLQFFKERERYE